MSSPTATPRLLTAEELEAMPERDARGNDARFELVAGRVVRMTPPGFWHGELAVGVAARLRAFVRAHRLGFTLVEVHCILARDPDTVLVPDVAFVRAERRPPPERLERYFEGAPDLAVEVVSPSNAAAEIAAKVRAYLAAGARLVWVVDPGTRTVTAHAPGAAPRTYPAGVTLDGAEVLPGFTASVAELFDDAGAD